MTRRLLLLASGLLLGAAEPAPPLPVHTGGRTVIAADGSRSFGWPGVYFEARFRGTAVRVRFDAPADHLRLSIDGKEHRVFRAPGAVDVTIDDLSPGEHLVRLEKLTESQYGSSRFIGFAAPGGSALRPQPRKRQIEFIGDSFTVGYDLAQCRLHAATGACADRYQPGVRAAGRIGHWRRLPDPRLFGLRHGPKL